MCKIDDGYANRNKQHLFEEVNFSVALVVSVSEEPG
jgi:hypothetical protein